MRVILILSLSLILGIACNNSADSKKTAEASIQEIKSTDVNQIVTDNTPTDTVNVAKMSFDVDRYNFGTVDEGEVVKHVYKFTNTGKIPLTISNARSTCGCTVPTWPKEPIGVGESGEIEVAFNTQGKRNKQRKPVTITANTYPAQTVVYLDGDINPVDLVPPSAKK